jgi:predicted transcriptional regulator
MIEMPLSLTGKGKRRDRQVIIAEITKIARNGASKTQIMYKANLCFSQINAFLVLLQEFNFLDSTDENGRVVYKTTSKGLEFLQKQQEIQQMLCADVNVKISMKTPPQILLQNYKQT